MGPHRRDIAIAVVLVALLAHRLLRPVVFRLSGYSTLLGAMVRRCDPPTRLLLPLLGLTILWQAASDDLPYQNAVEHVTAVLGIGCMTWLAIAAIQGVADGVIALHPADMADNLHARRVQTQTRVLARIAIGAALIAGLAFVLMTFPRARELGTSLLASAGVAGLVVGLAARSVFGNLVASAQVTDANERAMQLRVLVSAADAGRNFELRCIVREGLIGFVQRHHADALPRLRTDVEAVSEPRARPTEPVPGWAAA